MDSVGPPRPASTLLVVRDAEAGAEVLMVRRNLQSDFVGGAFVFPGGAVDPSDATMTRVAGLSEADADAVLGVVGARAYFVAALRELFEEAGVLVARDGRGAPLVVDLAPARRELNAGRLGFDEVLEREGLWLDLSGLAYLAHWVTPVGPPRRYDTRFFVVRAPAGQEAAHDDAETVAAVWVRPLDALAAQARGEYEMIFPTIRTLQSIAHLGAADEVLAFARSQRRVERVEPRLIERDGSVRVVVPGDEGYED
ncbi:MAG: NUDIX domain-containing protein [Acidobacteriota bacterium]|nr:NUDIX domain-containing protein [Acidobacteriota bacterium]